MARSGESDEESGSEGSGRVSSRSGEESSEEQFCHETKGKMSEYEKQRFSRIAENKARLEALGISKAATALLGPSPASRKRRGKRNSGEEDDDYRPGEGDCDEEEEIDEDFVGDPSSVSRKRKVICLFQISSMI